MAQNFTDDCFASGHVGQTDLQNMENNFACLKSMFSGGSAPSNPVAGMPWFDTTKKSQKQRNAGNTAWIGLMHGDASQKVWVYRNAAMDGWVVDGAVSDRVLAVKGGGTYTTGGATAGSWTISGLSGTGHTHGAGSYAAPNHAHTLANYGGSVSNAAGRGDPCGKFESDTHLTTKAGVGGGDTFQRKSLTTGNPSATAVSGTSASGNASPTHNGSWRVAAAVGTLQYLNL